MDPRHFSAHELVEMIRSRATYTDLAEKYGLTAHQLDQVLAKLVEKGLIRPEELPEKNATPIVNSQQFFTCPRCGASHSYKFDECPNCGVILSKLAQIEERRKHCPRCHYSQFPETTRCPKCGFNWVQYEKAQEIQRAEEGRQAVIKSQLEQWMTEGLPEVPAAIVLKKGELAHYTSGVDVFQQKTQTKSYRTYIGSRSRLFKIPVYFGASMPHTYSEEVIVLVGSGNFTITNKRVVLMGNKINYSIKHEKINGIQLYNDAVQLFDEGAKGGRFYKVDDPQHAALILGVLLNNL